MVASTSRQVLIAIKSRQGYDDRCDPEPFCFDDTDILARQTVKLAPMHAEPVVPFDALATQFAGPAS